MIEELGQSLKASLSEPRTRGSGCQRLAANAEPERNSKRRALASRLSPQRQDHSAAARRAKQPRLSCRHPLHGCRKRDNLGSAAPSRSTTALVLRAVAAAASATSAAAGSRPRKRATRRRRGRPWPRRGMSPRRSLAAPQSNEESNRAMAAAKVPCRLARIVSAPRRRAVPPSRWLVPDSTSRDVQRANEARRKSGKRTGSSPDYSCAPIAPPATSLRFPPKSSTRRVHAATGGCGGRLSRRRPQTRRQLSSPSITSAPRARTNRLPASRLLSPAGLAGRQRTYQAGASECALARRGSNSASAALGNVCSSDLLSHQYRAETRD